MPKGEQKYSLKRQQNSSDPDSGNDMNFGMSNTKFRIIKKNVLKSSNVKSRQQILMNENVSQEMDMLIKCEKKMLEIKNIVISMETAFVQQT